MKTIWGICALNHDASITVVRGNEILFAGHSERYSRIKNDPGLHEGLINAARQYGKPDEIVWFERPYWKKVRQAYAGQWDEVRSITPRQYLIDVGILNSIEEGGEIFYPPINYTSHHESHAAAGYFTSPFDEAAIIVVDAIGEWDTISVWHAEGDKMKKIHSTVYPNSVGLLYSAMTHRIGLKPNEEEYILMGMAAYGKPEYAMDIYNDFIEDMNAPTFKLKENLHRGCSWWRPELTSEQDYMDIAASIQYVVETFMVDLANWASIETQSENLVLMGGVALNCVANELIAKEQCFENIWIMPNPGDAGSSLGCILAHTRKKVKWRGPYLGTDIVKPLNTDAVVDAIINDKIIGFAHGRAEFGPRALGNRSLIADPRGDLIKNKVNDIKKRQRFRPFAPIVLEHVAHEYFDLPVATSPYMQYTAPCLKPGEFPAICHVDGSSRVQTLNKEQNPVFYEILSKFYERTGCPILLNTSLNIKGEPLVDTWEDALRFQQKHGVKIF
jgi:carbamoyltransferase